MSKYILSIDQGTTSSRAVIFNLQGKIKGDGQLPFQQHFPKPGWVEHDANEIWNTTVQAIHIAIKKAQIHSHEIAAIGITNQRETVLLWDQKTQNPLAKAIVWQCRRTTDLCNRLKPKWEKKIKAKTGLVLDPYFSASKIHWLLQNVKAAKKSLKSETLCAGTIDSWLLFKLTNGQSFKTDVSNASRTMLMNTQTGWWDSDLCKLFQVPEEILPEICSSNAVFGTTSNVPGLPDGIPIAGMIGDQQSALFGHGALKVGQSKCTFGTGSFLLMNTGNKSVASKKLLSTVAWKLQNQPMTYALEGGAFICGAAVQWLRDGLQLIKASSEVEALAKQVTSTDGVEFVPALSGLGAPHWKPEARGVITGLTRGSKKAHIALATLQAMALQNAEIFAEMAKDSKKKLTSVAVDGGATANNLLMQLQSDYLGIPVLRPHNLEVTALGAAMMAGLGAGLFSKIEDLKKMNSLERQFKSKMSAKSRQARMQSWQKAVQKAE